MKILAAGGVEVLMVATYRHPEVLSVQRHGCEALAALSSDNWGEGWAKIIVPPSAQAEEGGCAQADGPMVAGDSRVRGGVAHYW